MELETEDRGSFGFWVLSFGLAEGAGLGFGVWRWGVKKARRLGRALEVGDLEEGPWVDRSTLSAQLSTYPEGVRTSW